MSDSSPERPHLTREEWMSSEEAVRWLSWSGQRRSGTLGQLSGFRGEDASGQAVELLPTASGWCLRDPSGRQEDLDAAEVVALMGNGGFKPRQAIIRHDMPGLLFQAAVKAAQDSLAEATRADAGSGLPDEGDENSAAVVEFIIVTSAQDAAVRSAIGGIVLAVACAEAQVNAWADGKGGWSVTEDGNEDRLPLVRKCKALAAKEGVALDIGQPPYHALAGVVNRRIQVVHPKGEELVSLIGPETRPGRSLSIEARRACHVVRLAMVHLARSVGEEPPRYLAYCPPGPPEVDEPWVHAMAFAGARDDPDFPPVVPPRLR